MRKVFGMCEFRIVNMSKSLIIGFRLLLAAYFLSISFGFSPIFGFLREKYSIFSLPNVSNVFPSSIFSKSPSISP